MQKKLLYCFRVLCILLSTGVFAQSNNLKPTKGVIRVKLQEEVARQIAAKPVTMSNGVVATGIEPFDRAGREVNAVKMERLFPYVPKMEEKARKHGLHLWYEIVFDENTNPEEAMRIYSKVPGITIAENIVPMELKGSDKFVKVSPEEMAASLSSTRAAEMPFDDPLLSRQWHYNNDGTLPGSVVGADANIFKAWEVITGNKELVVAIIDGGIDYTHTDLAANISVNSAELNGKPGQDDDNNGYVDDVYGWNFVTNSNDIYGHSHGTHVAGTVGAVNNNGIGVAGIAGGNGDGGVKMVSCQVFDPRSSAQGDFAKAFYYAAVRDAVIAQCSWGWNSPGYKEQAVLDAIRFFTSEAESPFMKGGLVIFANGNTGDEGDYYPACMEEVVAVGSMTCTKKAAPYSTFGDWVDISAPGGFMDFNAAQGVYSTLPNNEYGYSEGTSMACPHVSGIAALVLSKYGNPNFPNETLRQQLLTSVNDFYTYNQEYEGKFGSGYIDAHKALQMGSGNAPQPVSDFTTVPGQDNIFIEWIIPASEDNNVNYHLVYYNTSEFSASDDLSKIPNKRIDTKFSSSGDKVNCEISALLPTTTYYIGIKAVDRWGNAAPLSSVKSATTNKGPKMELSKSELSLKIKASESNTAITDFIIKNTDEGLLKWHSFARTVSMKPNSFVQADPGRKTGFNGLMSMAPYNENAMVSADYNADDYPVSFRYYTSIAAYLGESDLKLTNSMAQWFYVDPEIYPDGFNLSDLYFEGAYGKDPIIEVYDGNVAISKSALLQTVKYDAFYYRWDIPLNEQLYFAPGSAFWVVVHYKAGNENPLTAGLSKESSYKNYSFYSSNGGESWTLLSEVLREGNLSDIADKVVWAITAKSKNPDWSSLMTLSPDAGTIKPAGEQKVEVSNDGQKMVNGNYKFNLLLQSNEAGNSQKTIPVNFIVEGYKPELQTPKVVNFGDLLVGQKKTLTVEVINSGYGVFTGAYGSLSSANISCTSDQFVVPTYQSGFSARATSSMEISFRPTKPGSHTATVNLIDKEGNKHTFVLRGIADEPAKIEITPSSFELGELEVGGEPRQVNFTISNTGKYPLEYVLPKYSDETLENAGKTAHKFGYSWISNLKGASEFEYDGNPELLNPTNISSQFSDQNFWSEAIPLGFSFPYYGKNYDKIYITSYGGLSVSTEGYLHVCMIPTASPSCIKGLGLIAAYGLNSLDFGPNSKIEYAKQDGKFTVRFKDVMALMHGGEYTPVSFRMSISSNGDIEIFYDDINPSGLFQQGAGLFIGVNDIAVQDPLTITDNDNNDEQLYAEVTSGSAVKILAPGKSMISALSSANGVIGIGESKEITATLKATDEMYAGALNNTLVILSNDPQNSTSYVHFNAVITGESLKPVAELETNTLDFGSVFRTSTVKAPLMLKNNGSDLLTVTALSLAKNNFSLDLKTPFDIKPGTAKDIVITMPTEKEGSTTDELTITTADGTTLKAAITGTVTGVPEITVNPETINETLASGTLLQKQVSIANPGNETLEYTLVPNSLINVIDQQDDNNSSISYVYSASIDDPAVQYHWEEIETSGEATHLKQSYWLNHDYVEVQLPYDINYYGNRYGKIYIYGVGFVSFNKKEDLNEAPNPPSTIPTTSTLYSNFIAPLWAYHFMDQSATAGVYYTVKEDQVIISFMEYGNSVNSCVCYQLIMYRDGKIKFQYKLSNTDYGSLGNLFGVAGMQNNAGDKGLLLPERCVAPEKAIEFYPVKSATVAPGKTSLVNVNINTDLLADNYKTQMVFQTNIPTAPNVEIPVNLTITGEAAPKFPKEVALECVTGTVTDMGVLEIPFEVSNTGTAAYKIKAIEAPGLIGYEGPVGMLQFYGKHIDDWFGEEFVGWGMYNPGTELIIGKDPLKLKVVAFDNYTVNNYEIPIRFTLEGADKEVVEVPFMLNITPAPSISFAQEEVRISGVSNDYKGETEVVLSNTGEYKLSYSLSLDPTGIGAETDNAPQRTRKANRIASADHDRLLLSMDTLVQSGMKSLGNETRSSLDIPDEQFNRLLYYPVYSSDAKLYLIGAGNDIATFNIATRYTAPKDGFNLSSIYFYATIGDLKNVDIKARIIQGSDVRSGREIGTGTLRVESEQPNGVDAEGMPRYTGAFRTLVLDNPVYLNPNETFYVSFTFPAGYPHSAAVVTKEDAVVEERYMYQFEGSNWYDAAADLENSLGSVGYFMTCIEKSTGEPWVTLLSPSEGKVEAGATTSIKIALNAATARLEKENKAVLVIRSNDPEKPIINYPVYLDKNSYPVIEAPEGIVYVKENEKSLMRFSVVDTEGDSYSIRLSDPVKIVSVESVEGHSESVTAEAIDANTIQVTSSATDEAAGVNVTVAFMPKFGHAGNHQLHIETVDVNGNGTKAAVPYYVEHVNRAPVAIDQDDIEVGVGTATPILSFSALFNDPDGDEMSYSLKLSEEGVADLFTASDGVIFVGVKTGEVTATVTATDTKGATSANTFRVMVVPATSLDNVTTVKEVTVYPNPIVEKAHITINKEITGDVTYRIHNAEGVLLYREVTRKSRGEVHTINMNDYPSGVYYLEVEADDLKSVIPLFK